MNCILRALSLALILLASSAFGQSFDNRSGGAMIDDAVAAIDRDLDAIRTTIAGMARLDAELDARLTALEGGAEPALTQLAPTPDGRFLVDGDGVPFFWFGDTVWSLPWRPSRADITMYLDDRASRGFNVIQFMAISTRVVGVVTSPEWNGPNIDGDRPFINGDVTRPNEAYWLFVDWLVDEISSRGMRAAMTPMWEDHIRAGRFKPWNADDYGRFIGKRYGSRPDVVIFNGGDLAVYRPSRSEDWRPVVRAFAAGVEASAPNALISYHPSGRSGSWFWLGKDAWLDFHMAQTGHCPPAAYSVVRKGYARDWGSTTAQTFPPKPVVDGEPVYEHLPLCFTGPGRATAQDIRRSAYHSVFAGGIGWTYGNNDSRQFLSAADGWEQTADWRPALDAPVIGDLRILKELIEAFDMLSRVPDQSLIVTTHSGKRRIVGTRGDGYALIYTPGGGFTARLGKIAGATVTASWLDPRTGGRLPAGSFANTGTRAFTPPSASDWVLVIETQPGV